MGCVSGVERSEGLREGETQQTPLTCGAQTFSEALDIKVTESAAVQSQRFLSLQGHGSSSARLVFRASTTNNALKF